MTNKTVNDEQVKEAFAALTFQLVECTKHLSQQIALASADDQLDEIVHDAVARNVRHLSWMTRELWILQLRRNNRSMFGWPAAPLGIVHLHRLHQYAEQSMEQDAASLSGKVVLAKVQEVGQ